MNIGTLQAYLGLETAEFDAKMAKSVKSIEKAGKKMRDIGTKMSLMITLPLMLAGGAAVKLASDLEENINKTKESFKQAADSVLEWSDTTVTSIGLAKSTALEMVSLFGDMATSMGYSREGAAELSMSLVTLAADLASFKNISIEQAQTALAGIFTGETESLKRLGIVMTQAALESFTAAKGMKEYSDKMTQAEKIAVRYAYVMDVTKNAQGDFANTAGGTANQMRIFQESVKELGASFGKFLLPVITPMIKGFSQLMTRMSTLTDVQKKWIIGIAAVAAAIGPFLLGLGTIIKIAPTIVTALTAVRGAVVKLTAAILTNPYLALGAAIIAIGVGLYTWSKRTNELETAQKKINTQISEEVWNLNLVFGALQKTETGTKQRTAAINTANAKYGKYLSNLLTEKSTLEDIKKAQSEATRAIIADITVKENKNALTSELSSINNKFEKEFSAFTKEYQKRMGGENLSFVITDIYAEIEAEIEAGNGKIERAGVGGLEWSQRARDLWEKYFKEISQGYGFIKFSADDFQKSFLDFAEFKAKKNPVIDYINSTIDAYSSMIKVFDNPELITDPETPTEEIAELQNKIKKVNADYEVTKELLTDENALQKAKIKHLQDVFELNKQIYLINPTKAGLQALKDEWAVLEKTVTTAENKLTLAEHLDFINEKAIERSKAIKEAEQGINEEYKLALYLAQDKKAQLQAEYDRLSSIYQLKKQLAGEDKVFSEEELAALKLINDQLTAQKFILDAIPQTWAEKWSSAAEQVESAINQAMETVVDGLINAMTSVEKVDIGQFLMNTLAELAIRVGKIALMTAIAIEGIKKALMSLNPVAALVAGIALIALGTAVKTSLANSVQGLATGGIVTKSGAFMVGEEGPELANFRAGTAITPNHLLGNTGGGEPYILSTRISGRDLEVIMERAKAQNKRRGK